MNIYKIILTGILIGLLAQTSIANTLTNSDIIFRIRSKVIGKRD